MALVDEEMVFCTEFQLVNAAGMIELEQIAILRALMK